MKRLAWIFLAAFCTLLAQVQPVGLPASQSQSCGCCEGKGSCGMPDCAPAPQAARSIANLATVRATQIEVREVARPKSKQAVPFYLTLVSSPAEAPVLRVSQLSAPAAKVPLFKAQCSFLL